LFDSLIPGLMTGKLSRITAVVVSRLRGTLRETRRCTTERCGNNDDLEKQPGHQGYSLACWNLTVEPASVGTMTQKRRPKKNMGEAGSAPPTFIPIKDHQTNFALT